MLLIGGGKSAWPGSRARWPNGDWVLLGGAVLEATALSAGAYQAAFFADENAPHLPEKAHQLGLEVYSLEEVGAGSVYEPTPEFRRRGWLPFTRGGSLKGTGPWALAWALTVTLSTVYLIGVDCDAREYRNQPPCFAWLKEQYGDRVRELPGNGLGIFETEGV